MIVTYVIAFMAFVLFVLFEEKKLRSKKLGKNAFNPYFILGTIVLLAVWIDVMISSLSDRELLGMGSKTRIVLGAILLVISLTVYIYVLFFALPKDIYRSDREQGIVKTGIYGKMRHPGVYCFLMAAMSAALVSGSKRCLIFGIYLSLLNLVYTIIQDIHYFPLYIESYDEYKKEVPFMNFLK